MSEEKSVSAQNAAAKKSHATWRKINGILMKHWIWVAVFAGVATFVIAMIFGWNQSIWFDEAYSVQLIHHSFGELVQLTSVDAHPPLFYILLKIWAGIFGYGEHALRAFSAVCSGFAITGVIVLARHMFGRGKALFAAPFVVLAPFVIRYAYEIRMYALAMLIIVLALYALVRAMQTEKNRYWVWFAILVALGMWALYYTMFVWIGIGVWCLAKWFFVKEKKRGNLLKQPWFLSFVGAVALFIPWIPSFMSQWLNSALPSITESVGVPQLSTIFSFEFLYKPYWAIQPHAEKDPLAWMQLLLILIIIAVVYVIVRAYQLSSKQQKSWTSLLLCVSIVPIVVVTLISLPPFRPLFMERYIAHFAVFTYLLVGVGLVTLLLRKHVRRWPTVLLTVFFLCTLIFGLTNLYAAGNYNYQRLQRPVSRDVTQAILPCESDKTILIEDILEYFEMESYLPENCENVYFYVHQPIGDRGGFVPVKNSPRMIVGDQKVNITTPKLVVVDLEGNDPYAIDDSYQKVNSQTFDKVTVTEYQKSNAE